MLFSDFPFERRARMNFDNNLFRLIEKTKSCAELVKMDTWIKSNALLMLVPGLWHTKHPNQRRYMQLSVVDILR